MPIMLAPIGVEMNVVRVSADDKIKKHLESLGITVQSKITIVSQCGGSVICNVKDFRLALDRELASKILVA